MYFAVDGITVTLPATPAVGQVIAIDDVSCSASNSGFTLNANSGQSLFIINTSGSISGSTAGILCITEVVYNSNNSTWYSLGLTD